MSGEIDRLCALLEDNGDAAAARALDALWPELLDAAKAAKGALHMCLDPEPVFGPMAYFVEDWEPCGECAQCVLRASLEALDAAINEHVPAEPAEPEGSEPC